MTEGDMRRQISPPTGGGFDHEAVENLRTFFALLQEWDELNRIETEQVRQQRAAWVVADRFGKGVESG